MNNGTLSQAKHNVRTLAPAEIMALLCPQAEACGLTPRCGGGAGYARSIKAQAVVVVFRQATNWSDDFTRARERETGSNVRTLGASGRHCFPLSAG